MLTLLQKRNLSTIRGYILQNNGDASDAEDVLQEAIVVVWQKAQSTDFELTARLDTFIYAIARNLWLKTLRKQGRMTIQDFTDGPFANVAEEREEELDDKQAILAAYMSKIGDTCRQLLSLFYYDGLDMEKIAQRMNFANAQTAKAKKYQCKKKLEQLIRAHYSAADLL